MFEKNSLQVRLKNASPELVLSWLDKWDQDGKYNLDEDDEKIIVDRDEPLLDAALTEYSANSTTLSRIYERGDTSLKKACLSNSKRNVSSYFNEWPFDGTFQKILNNSDLERGLLDVLVTNPSFDIESATDVIDKLEDFATISDNNWRSFLSSLSRNPLMKKRSLFGQSYEVEHVKFKLWRLSETLPTTQENADFLYNLYSGLAPVESDDPKHENSDLYNSDKGSKREFVVERAIQKWKHFTPKEEDRVRQGFFLIKGRCGDDICRQLLKNLENDTIFFASLEKHASSSYREYFYRNVDWCYYDDENTEVLDRWFEKDRERFLKSLSQNYQVVCNHSCYKWLNNKVEKMDRDLQDILKGYMSAAIGQENRTPYHLKQGFDLSSTPASDTKRIDRLGLQVDLIFKNLLGDRDVTDEHIYLGDNASLSIIAQELGYVKGYIRHLKKQISVLRNLVITALVFAFVIFLKLFF